MAGWYHVWLMQCGLDQSWVDVAVQWVAPLWEPHEALLAMALYETHTAFMSTQVNGAAKSRPLLWGLPQKPGRLMPPTTAYRPSPC